MNSNDLTLIERNPSLKIVTDSNDREWLTVKMRNGFDRQAWWCRPTNCEKNEDFKTAGTTIAERNVVLNALSDEYVADTWKTDDTNRVELDRRIRKYTAFKNFDDLVSARGNYVPTIRIDAQPEMRMIAEAYDAHMIETGDLRRAYATYPRTEQQKRDKIAVAEWKEERRIERERRIAAAELKTVNNAHREAVKINDQMRLDNPTTPIELAKSAKAAAKAVIKSCRRDRNRFEFKTHFTHRGVDVIAINADGERCSGDSPIFFDLNEISGRSLKDAAQTHIKHHGDDVVEISVQGGIDAHESFAVFMEDARNGGFGDYDPMVDEWECSLPIEKFA